MCIILCVDTLPILEGEEVGSKFLFICMQSIALNIRHLFDHVKAA